MGEPAWVNEMSVPKVLSIAGTDPSGGAGIQADLKAMSALRAYGLSVITGVVAQSTQGVAGVQQLPAEFVDLQLKTLLADVAPDAVKIGMLTRRDIVDLIRERLPELPNTVLDPVMISTSGHHLLDEDAVASMRLLAREVDLVTPNLAEVALLLELPQAQSVQEARAHALALHGLGSRRVLVKGGHLPGAAVDIYVDEHGIVELEAPRLQTKNTHGTGCTLSSAIAALVPQRDSWLDAVLDAKTYLYQAILSADDLSVGNGKGPVHHFHTLW